MKHRREGDLNIDEDKLKSFGKHAEHKLKTGLVEFCHGKTIYISQS